MAKSESCREQLIALHKRGLSNIQIAKELGVNKNSVGIWLEKFGLRSRATRNSHQNQEEFLRLYRSGLNDSEIARRVGCNSTTVCEWRNKQGLPVLRNQYSESKIKYLYQLGLSDKSIVTALGSKSHTPVVTWRKKHGLSENVEI